MVTAIVAVCLGASAGALGRYGLGLLLNGVFPAIPLGTLAANLTGCFLMGAALYFFALRPDLDGPLRLLFCTGFLGALTTFSAFSGEVAVLLQQGRMGYACAAIALHVGGSLLMTFVGMAACAGVVGKTA